MNKEEVRKETYSYLNLLIASSLMQEYLDQLKGSDKYRNMVKVHAKGLSGEIEKLLNTELAKLYSNDEGMMVNLGKNFEVIVSRLSSLPPHELMAVSQFIECFFEDKDGFLERNPIMMQKLDS